MYIGGTCKYLNLLLIIFNFTVIRKNGGAKNMGGDLKQLINSKLPNMIQLIIIRIFNN
jgi:hypothetical protein